MQMQTHPADVTWKTSENVGLKDLQFSDWMRIKFFLEMGSTYNPIQDYYKGNKKQYGH